MAAANADLSTLLAARNRLRDIGRNAPCPCGSGHKYKKCCLPLDEATTARAASALPHSESTNLSDRPGGTAAGSRFNESATGIDETPAFTAEIEAALDRAWDDYKRTIPPTAAAMDALLTRLLALPPEATSWSDLFSEFAAHDHADLPGVFRRIVATVPPAGNTSLAFLHWVAAERFVKQGRTDLVGEIVRGFRTLDGTSYDPDALHHVWLWTLAAGGEAEAVALLEHFLPIQRAASADHLMAHVVPEACRGLFELRAGRLVAAGVPEASTGAIATELRRDIEEEINPEFALRAA